MKKYTYLLFITIGLLIFGSCQEPITDGSEKPTAEQSIMLENYADNLIIPAYKESLNSSRALLTKLNSSEAKNVTNLETLFVKAYSDWQKCTFFNFGPAKTYSLGTDINTYPVDQAKIDLHIENGVTDVTDFLAPEKGFPALDYIIFSGKELEEKEIGYLKAVITDIISRQENTVSEWESFYRDAFVTNGGYNSGSAISFVLNAFIQYYERDMRDGKLGIPLGIRSTNIKQPSKSEALFSGISHELFHANVTAMKNFYNGGSGYGLDELLRSEDSSLDLETADEIQQNWNLITDKTGNLNSSINDYVASNEAEAKELYGLIQRQLVLLKIETTSSLGVKINFLDTDGD